MDSAPLLRDKLRIVEQGISTDQRFLKYHVRREIGRGGMGVVFEAWDTDLHRSVALKVLYGKLLAGPGNASRVHSEARAAAVLRHPNIVRVHTLIEHDGITAIDMEYVEGRSLGEVLAAGPLGTSRSAHILVQVLSALEACHKKGMAHLDLKPSNILLTPEGHIYLTDFGLACAVGRTKPVADEIESVRWSTPRYAPPELWRGAEPATTWDIYSAGVVACECLAGPLDCQLDKRSGNLFAEHAALRQRVSNISPEFARLLERMLAKNPKNRPANAMEALAEFRNAPEFAKAQGKLAETQLFSGSAESAGLETVTVQTTSRRPRRRGWWFAAAIAMLMLAAVGSVYAWYHATPETSAPAAKAENIAPPPSAAPVTKSAVESKDPPYSSSPGELCMMRSHLFFTADDGESGRALWYIDDSTPRRISTDNKGQTLASACRVFATDDDVYFSAETVEGGTELYKCAIVSGIPIVMLLKDVIPGAMGSSPEPLAFHWPYLAFYSTTREFGRELWSTYGGRTEQTAIVADSTNGPQGSAPEKSICIVAGDQLVLAEYVDGCDGLSLNRYRFSDNSVKFLADVSEDFIPGVAVGGHAYFAQSDKEHGRELWSIDIESGATRLIRDIAPGGESSSPQQIGCFGDRFLFKAQTLEEGYELWISDGTLEGTQMLLALRPGPEGSDPQYFKAADSLVFFKANDGEHGMELWVTDGTKAGTRIVRDIRPGPEGSDPYNIVPGKDIVAFSANDGTHGEELWIAAPDADAWHAYLASDILPGPSGSEPTDLVWTGDLSGAFVANWPGIGRELLLFSMSSQPSEYINIEPFDICPEPGNAPKSASP